MNKVWTQQIKVYIGLMLRLPTIEKLQFCIAPYCLYKDNYYILPAYRVGLRCHFNISIFAVIHIPTSTNLKT